MGGALPSTGGDVATFVVLALFLVALGVLLWWYTRSPRQPRF